MIIKKMTASFGALENDTLELKDGLNIVAAPNESGKSTWCAFIKAMLYGVDSSAREKGGVKPDKVRYAPWSGQPMAGTMEIEAEGKNLTLTRQGRASAPMKDFSATVTGTGEHVNVPANAVGETLLGVSRDVFERSAFIGQGRVPVTGSPEIEKRIAAVVQTGDEGASVTQAQENLKAAMRRRRYNRSGRLPELEGEMEKNRASLAEITIEKDRGAELREAKARAVAKRAELTERAAEARKESRARSLERLTDSRAKISGLETAAANRSRDLENAENALNEDIFGDVETEKCREKVKYDLDANAVRADKAAKGGSKGLNIALLVVLAAAAVLLNIFKVLDGTPLLVVSAALGILAIVQAVRLAKLLMMRSAAGEETEKLLKTYGCATLDEIARLPELHEQKAQARENARAALSDAQETLKAACADRDEIDKALLSDLDFTAGDSEAARYTKLLEQAETELRVLREETAAWEGRQSALGSAENLEKQYEEMKAEHNRLTFEYDALALALETLTEAGAEIQNRMTPELSKRAAEYFNRLTGGRYDTVQLSRSFEAAAKLENDAVARESAFLSVGALDQLYLAVRLAVCALALPEDKCVPIILDDALVNFDDVRAVHALELLHELASEKQIILFTCHGREGEYAKMFADTNIISC